MAMTSVLKTQLRILSTKFVVTPVSLSAVSVDLGEAKSVFQRL